MEIQNNVVSKKYNITANEDGFLYLLSKDVSESIRPYIEELNSKKIKIENKEKRYKFLEQIDSPMSLYRKWPQELLSEIKIFIHNYEKYSKERRKEIILSNPDKHRIVRPIAEHQNTAIHLFTRNQVFQIVSDENRKKYTKISEIDGEVFDISIDREFLGWGGKLKFKITGPILCDYDQKVFDSLIKIWHEKHEAKGSFIETNLSEIWKYLGNKGNCISGSRIESIKRSLRRLADSSVTVKSLENKSFWVGGVVDDVLYISSSNPKNNKIKITFNKYMLMNYLSGSYSTISHPIYQILSPYARKIYLFIMSHEDQERKMQLEKWREPLGASSTIEKKEFKRKMKEAIKELVEKNIVHSESSISRKDEVCISVTRQAWESKLLIDNIA